MPCTAKQACLSRISFTVSAEVSPGRQLRTAVLLVAALVPETYGRYRVLAMIFASPVWMRMSFVIAVYQAVLVSALLLPQKLLRFTATLRWSQGFPA